MARTIPLSVWKALFPKRCIALSYHIVSGEDLPHAKFYAYKSPAEFEDDVAFAASDGGFMPYEELVSGTSRDRPGPMNRYLFTFDDGFSECFDVVRPILLRHSARGVFFVTLNFLDDRNMFWECKASLCLREIERADDEQVRRAASLLGVLGTAGRCPTRSDPSLAARRLPYARIAPPNSPAHLALTLWLLGLDQTSEPEIDRVCELLGVSSPSASHRRNTFLTSEQVRRLVDDGFTVGAHGLSHRSLAMLDEAGIEREIAESCRAVCELTGKSRVPFAFPYNGANVDRRLLQNVIEKYNFIDMIFDSGGLRRDVSCVINRVSVDYSRPGEPASQTSLRSRLRREWFRRESWCRPPTG